jgi:membrane-associated phospholipid phosphatase
MTDKTLHIAGLRLRATDGLILFTLSFFSILALLFSPSVQGWWVLIIKNIGVGAAYLALIFASEKTTRKFPRFLLRVVAVTLTYAYLFGAVDKLQLILHGQWFDAYVMDAEQYIFGVQPTLWLEHITTPPLTEWMMFAYVIYVPLYPVLCGIIYYLRGDVAMEDYLFTLGFTNILCDIGFILFPVAGPMATIGNLYSVPLKGYVFTFFGELMRLNLHFVGGNIPSPHTAAATIMWVMAYRYHRPSFYILTPVVLSLYVSTFYLRYHFVTDAVVGVIVAFLALLIVPFLVKAWDRLAEKPMSAPTVS